MESNSKVIIADCVLIINSHLSVMLCSSKQVFDSINTEFL